jgi:fatty acid-binding protein DegV
MDRAYGNYIRRTLQGKKDINPSLLCITYAGCSARQLKEFQERVNKYQSFERIILQKTSATISSNCGLGAMGLAYVKQKEKAPKWYL